MPISRSRAESPVFLVAPGNHASLAFHDAHHRGFLGVTPHRATDAVFANSA